MKFDYTDPVFVKNKRATHSGSPVSINSVNQKQEVPCFATFNQVSNAGRRIRKGALPDKLFMPDLSEFESPEKYYHTYFHGLSHWTGHHSRLNRDIKNRFGDEQYSKEELIAEMSACFLAAHCGIVVEDLVENSAAYLRSWINVLHGDARLLMTAASAAERAASFLIDGTAAVVVEMLEEEEQLQAA